jgi:hypothetical protein
MGRSAGSWYRRGQGVLVGEGRVGPGLLVAWRVMAVWGVSASCGVGPISSAGLRTNPTLMAGHSI